MAFCIPYRGNLTWLVPRTVLYVVHGSRAYGTHTETSDYDYKGVAVPPSRYRDGFVQRFEQAESKEPDSVIYDVRKFFQLAAECNPNIVEVLWADEADTLVLTAQGRRIRDARALFLSKKALHTFRGYAMAQLKRIESHRRWLLDPPRAAPSRADHGLPERTVIPADQLAAAQAAMRARLDAWEVDFGSLDEAEKLRIQEQVASYLAELSIGARERFTAAGRLLGYEENFLDLLDRERRYNAALSNWQQYENWKRNRNQARAALESSFGYDTKHAYHLVRLLRMCREVLTEGLVRVKRPDADELKEVRDGAWSYERLMEWASAQDSELQAVARTSTLPNAPDREALDALCCDIVRSMDG